MQLPVVMRTVHYDVALMLMFPLILLIGLLIRLSLFILRLDIDPSALPLLSRTGRLNTYFAGHSFEEYTSIFILITAFLYLFKSSTVRYDSRPGSILPVTSRDLVSDDSGGKNLITKQLIKLALLFSWINILISWFFGDPIFERILKGTGGRCSNGNAKLSYHQCLADDGNVWVGGTKMSGHSLILSCFTVTLLFEVHNLITVYRINRLNGVLDSISAKRYQALFYWSLIAISGTAILIWLSLFTITAIFYHTILEKIVGLTCGLVVPYLFYFKCKNFFQVL